MTNRTTGRVILIVLDSVGVGQAPDAALYGDEGANTLQNVSRAVHGLHVPHMASMGLGRICPLEGVATDPVRGAYGYMIPKSAGKDTTNGHLEFVGVTLSEPLPLYPNGFPDAIMRPFESQIGRRAIGNRPASGTEILKELGDEHVRTGYPIVYTSGDSVFQIAAHEEVIPLATLYSMCEIARNILVGEHGVGRVIARPFVGSSGSYVRTGNRRDYSRDFGRTMLEDLTDAGIPVIGVGKIEDIYGGRGITKGIHTENNDQGITATVDALRTLQGPALLFTNLVDFDALYGHRNDPQGFAHAIEAFDHRLPEIMDAMTESDTLLLTADHGCDPTTPSTDHSREGVPLLVWRPSMTGGIPLGRRDSYVDLGASIVDGFGLRVERGHSFWEMLS